MPFTSSLGGGSTRSWGGIGFAGGDVVGPPFYLSQNLTYQGGTLITAAGNESAQNTFFTCMSMSDDGVHFYLHGKFWVVGGQYRYGHFQYDLSANPYQIQSPTYVRGINVGLSPDDGNRITRWKPDGTEAYNLSLPKFDNVNGIYKFTASTPYNIQTVNWSPSTISLSTSLVGNFTGGSYFSVRAYHFFDNGNKVIVAIERHGNAATEKGDTINVWNLSTPYDFSTASFDSSADTSTAKDLDHTLPSGGLFYAAAFANDGQTLIAAMQPNTSDTTDFDIYTFYIPGRKPSKLKFVSRRDGFNNNDAEWTSINDGTYPGVTSNMISTNNIILDPINERMWHIANNGGNYGPDYRVRRWDF